jgi:UDP-N-acetylmuramyl pentapeptide synthase
LEVLNSFTGKKIAVLGQMAELGDKSDAYHRQIGQKLQIRRKLLCCLFLNKVGNYTHNFLMICSNFATLEPLKRMVQSVCCLSVVSNSNGRIRR